MRSVRFASVDPVQNLALEEALFDSLEAGDPGWFLLWRNSPSVIVGRHQNTAEEIDCARMSALSLPVVRRMTGGGAVYHDLGNLNFSFLCWRENEGRLDFAAFLEPVVKALQRLGVDARITGRNDLEAGGRKISGSAQRISHGRVLHHGTLLVSPDFEAMQSILSPDPGKYLSKGVSSVKARVTGLSSLWRNGSDMEALCRILEEECADVPGSIPQTVLEKAERLAAEKYSQWKWNFGTSPSYTEKRKQRFPWGSVEVLLDVQRGIIRTAGIRGDFFAVRDIEILEGLLAGRSRNPEELLPFLEELPLGDWFSGCCVEETARFLASL